MKLNNAYIIGWIDNGYVEKRNVPFGYQHRSEGDVSYISLVMFLVIDNNNIIFFYRGNRLWLVYK